MMPGLPEVMIKGNERAWVSFFFGKKGRDGTIPREAIDEYVRCYSIENTPATAASFYRSMALDAPHWATLLGKKVYHAVALYLRKRGYGDCSGKHYCILKIALIRLKWNRSRRHTFFRKRNLKKLPMLMNNFLQGG